MTVRQRWYRSLATNRARLARFLFTWSFTAMSKHSPTNKLQFNVFLILVSMLVLTACNTKPQATNAPPASATAAPPTETPTATRTLPEATAQPTPSASYTPTEEVGPTETMAPEQVASATATEPSCVALHDPENGADLPITGLSTFAWDAWPGATNYLLDITVPNGWVLSVETQETQVARSMEAFSSGGEYSWMVSALDSDGQVLCQTSPRQFSKLARQTPTEQPKPPKPGPSLPGG